MEDTAAYYPAAPETVAAVAQRAGIDLVVLFGSVARGRQRADSDLDIAVRFVAVGRGSRRKRGWLASFTRRSNLPANWTSSY